MDIVIIADFCGSFDGSGNSRFLYLASILQEKHNVEVITSDYNHGKKAFFSEVPKMYSFKITMLHEPAYRRNICLKRFYSHYKWGQAVAKYLKKRKRPDVIYCAIPPLTAAYNAAQYCKKTGVKYIIDIQDLWPEAFQMVFRVPVLSDIVFAPLKWIANKIYRSADEVCAVSQSYVQRVLNVNSNIKVGHTVFLGTRLETFDENVKNNVVSREKDGKLWLGYCGALANSYDLNCVFDALEMLKNKGIEAPRFVVMGDGVSRQKFEDYAASKDIEVVFTGRLPYDEMCGLLCACDITVNPIVKGSAASIINKHGDYAASGLPVLNTQESQEYRDLVEKYHMGINCENGNAADLCKKMEILIEDTDLRKEMGRNARRCAEEKFDRKISYTEIIELICSAQNDRH